MSKITKSSQSVQVWVAAHLVLLQRRLRISPKSPRQEYLRLRRKIHSRFSFPKYITTKIQKLIIFCRVIPSTIFKKCYDRGDLPIVVDFLGAHRKVILLTTQHLSLDILESGSWFAWLPSLPTNFLLWFEGDWGAIQVLGWLGTWLSDRFWQREDTACSPSAHHPHKRSFEH